MRDPSAGDLRHVYWIGGSPGAGKSTVARRLADRFGLHLYPTDDVMRDHAARSREPYIEQFKAMDMDERWLTRSPEVMLETFPWFRGEAFHLVVEDLLSVPPGTRVVAEGFRLLPHLVAPLLADPRQAVWLLPTHAFAEAAHQARGSTWTIPNLTSDPARTRANLIARDAMFTARLTGETRRLRLPCLPLDVPTSEDDVYEQVTRMFGLRIPSTAAPRRPESLESTSTSGRGAG
jgi:hypothetical protein